MQRYQKKLPLKCDDIKGNCPLNETKRGAPQVKYLNQIPQGAIPSFENWTVL